MNRLLSVTFNASGAFHGAKHGDVVVVVDTIDMSTTAEALISQVLSVSLAQRPTREGFIMLILTISDIVPV